MISLVIEENLEQSLNGLVKSIIHSNYPK